MNFYKDIQYFEGIYIEKSEFDSNFKINGIDIDYVEEKLKKITNNYNIISIKEMYGIFNINILSIEETKFNKKFELKKCVVDDFNFKDSNIKGIFDVYRSSFIKSRFYKSIFEEFAAFEQVVFGDRKIENKTELIYTTFKDFSNFRNTIFKSGLSFSKANFKQEPNFLNTDINLKGTDRETLRIVKNSFEKNNNKIETNRFFIYEMNSYREEMKEEIYNNILYKKIIEANNKIIDYVADCNNSFFIIFFISIITSICIIFIFIFFLVRIPVFIFNFICNNFNLYFKYLVVNINYFISGFGESYIRPVMIFLFSIGLYTYIERVHKSIFEGNSSLKGFLTQDWVVLISDFLNDCALNVPLFSKALENKSGIEFISLLFFIWFGILTWQIIVAVKRNTQH